MKLNILEKNDETMKFVLEGVSLSFANALRRVMMSEVPTMSVDWVDFHDNKGPLFDEKLAHRIGLVPLTFDPSKFNLPDECECGGKGCPLCQVVLVLEKKGPCTVMSGDLKSTNKEVAPVYDNIPLTVLDENHSLKLEAFAHLGIGKNHAKNQAAIAVCTPYPKIVADKGVSAKKIAEAFPKGVLSVSGTKITVEDPFRVYEFEDVLEQFKGKVSIKSEDNKFLFKVETVCGLPPEKIVEEAVKVLKKKGEEFKKLLQKL